MKRFGFVPRGFRLIGDERVEEGDFYWCQQDYWLPVHENMVGFKIKYDVVRRKNVRT